MQPFVTLTGVAAPLLTDNLDTDQIAPVSAGSRQLHPDYAALFFARRRFRADGSEDPGFVLNRGPFRAARILVTGARFGCGSARETAVWALAAFGIRCIVARSFAEMYRDNCLSNGILPIVLEADEGVAFERDVVAVDGAAPYAVDLRDPHILAPSGRRYDFSISAAERHALLEGTDPVDLTLREASAIEAWEARTRRERPWLQNALGGGTGFRP